MARIFKTPFGAQGDTEQVPEAPQGDGSVSLAQGFGYDYEREYEDPAAKDIRREVMNGLFHDITEAIGDIQLTGIAKWDAAAAPYPAGAVVWHNNNSWRSAVGNNSAAPTEGANWSRLPAINEISSGFVPQSRSIASGTGLSGGGNLTANRTLSVNYGTTAGTAAQGNDVRLDAATVTNRGTTRLASAQQARLLAAPAAVITPDTLGSAMEAHVLGMGQTWQDFRGSRTLNTNYTNSTGRVIFVAVSVSSESHLNVDTGLLVGGFFVSRHDSTSDGFKAYSVGGFVLPGQVYSVVGGSNLTLTDWMELR